MTAKKKGNTPKYVTETINTYDPWISVKKFLIQGGIVGLVAFLTYIVEQGLPELLLEAPQYAGIITIVSAVIVFVLNTVKHYKDTKLVEVNPNTGKIVRTL